MDDASHSRRHSDSLKMPNKRTDDMDEETPEITMQYKRPRPNTYKRGGCRNRGLLPSPLPGAHCLLRSEEGDGDLGHVLEVLRLFREAPGGLRRGRGEREEGTGDGEGQLGQAPEGRHQPTGLRDTPT